MKAIDAASATSAPMMEFNARLFSLFITCPYITEVILESVIVGALG